MDYHMILYNDLEKKKGLAIVFKFDSDNPMFIHIYIIP